MRSNSVRVAILLPAAGAAVVVAVACAPQSRERASKISQAATAPALGTAASFAVLGGLAVVNTNATVVSGNVGVSPGSTVSGFPPGVVNDGTIQAGTAVAAQAQSDTLVAYDALAAQACDQDLTGQDLGGLTLVPGTYCFSGSAFLTGTLTLDAQGDPDAVFVFRTGNTLITGTNASVQTINGGDVCNIYWQVGSSATIGTGTTFAGTIIALAGITLASGASVVGRALARAGTVTMDSNTVNSTVCGQVTDAGGSSASSGSSGSSGTSSGSLVSSGSAGTSGGSDRPGGKGRPESSGGSGRTW